MLIPHPVAAQLAPDGLIGDVQPVCDLLDAGFLAQHHLDFDSVSVLQVLKRPLHLFHLSGLLLPFLAFYSKAD